MTFFKTVLCENCEVCLYFCLQLPFSDYQPGYYYTINYCFTGASSSETSLLPIKLKTPEGITLTLHEGKIASQQVNYHVLDPQYIKLGNESMDI